MRFKEDFGGEEDIRPAAKEDVDESTGTSRIPAGPIPLVPGENFNILSARLPTPTPQLEGFRPLAGFLSPASDPIGGSVQIRHVGDNPGLYSSVSMLRRGANDRFTPLMTKRG